MKYFGNFPLIFYPIKYNTGYEFPAKKDLIEYAATVDMNIRYRILTSVSTNPFASYEHLWSDTDTPYILAQKYYGDFYYDWLVMLSADLFDWQHDLPLRSEVLNKYIEQKYDVTFEQALDQVHHYEDGSGFWIDLDTYMIEPEPKRIVSVFQHEFEQNESKRVIKLISRELLMQINLEFEGQLKNIRDSRATREIV